MTHPTSWKDWFIQTPECVAAHPRPGSCVGQDGPLILGAILLSVILVLLGVYLYRKLKK